MAGISDGNLATESGLKPRLTETGRPVTVAVEAINEHGEMVLTRIPGEHPLTLYLDKREIVTLMTLGAAPESLVLGYLRNQRLVSRIEDIAAVQVDWETDSAAVTTRNGSADLEQRLERRTVTSGCGQGTMFGDLMESLDEVALPDDVFLDAPTLAILLDNVRRQDSIYKEAGAVHGCALATADGEILMFIEDVGRHNAVDAIAGQMWLKNMRGGDKLFYTTGRLTSEMVIKAAQMGIPFMISRSGLTEMGHAIARKIGLTVIGRATGKHYLLFTGQHRFKKDVAAMGGGLPD
ncbi:MAG: formate dehydrogenase accessory sulfurtransferase FdhD [Sulfuritalea sp.]|jgi:FdhD protein|nr:formate dehydrogenase accessory sulfurtransferase FdhD [Sulfuritalea sp.]